MPDKKRLSRRALIEGLAAGALVASPTIALATHAMGPMKRLPPRWASPSFSPDVEIELIAAPGSAQILEGKPTNVWRYAARLVKGPEGTLTRLDNSYLAELIRLRTGQKLRITLRNQLPEPNIAHWHGLHAPAEMDGHPAYALDPGQSYVYEFEIRNRAGFYFFHPHTHEATATQVYRGLAGGIIVNDAEEDALGLPSGEYELPIVLQDRSFNDENQLVYDVGMHERMIGFQGERILVNGKADYAQDVASRAYRLRILNASNARIYKLAWDDGSPVVVLGVDGGLLAAPETKPYVMLAPGERLDVWADFSGRKTGETIVMRSLPFAGAAPAMAARMQRMMGGSGLPAGGEFPLFALRVARETSESPALPQRLSTPPFPRIEAAANPHAPRPIAISEMPMAMLINGRPYSFDDALEIEKIPLNTTQLFEIFHQHGGMGHMAMGGGMGMRGMGMGGMGMGGIGMGGMMSMAHPIHLHGQQFAILDRVAEMVDEDAYATVKDGFVMSGLKDTVPVFSGERVRILKPFDDYAGRFMYHCHNLEHEDMGMMREFVVG
jgi:blue copper oxidase